MSKTLSYILILIGAVVAVYAKAAAEQNQLILIGGIVILMIGIYSVSSRIPSKREKEEEDNDGPTI